MSNFNRVKTEPQIALYAPPRQPSVESGPKKSRYTLLVDRLVSHLSSKFQQQQNNNNNNNQNEQQYDYYKSMIGSEDICPPLAALSVSSESRKIRALIVAVTQIVKQRADGEVTVILADKNGGRLSCVVHPDVVRKYSNEFTVKKGTMMFLVDVSLIVIGPRCAFLAISELFQIKASILPQDEAAKKSAMNPRVRAREAGLPVYYQDFYKQQATKQQEQFVGTIRARSNDHNNNNNNNNNNAINNDHGQNNNNINQTRNNNDSAATNNKQPQQQLDPFLEQINKAHQQQNEAKQTATFGSAKTSNFRPSSASSVNTMMMRGQSNNPNPHHQSVPVPSTPAQQKIHNPQQNNNNHVIPHQNQQGNTGSNNNISVNNSKPTPKVVGTGIVRGGIAAKLMMNKKLQQAVKQTSTPTAPTPVSLQPHGHNSNKNNSNNGNTNNDDDDDVPPPTILDRTKNTNNNQNNNNNNNNESNIGEKAPVRVTEDGDKKKDSSTDDIFLDGEGDVFF